MEARFIGIGRWRILFCKPRHHAFGILVADVLIALHVAKQTGLRLLFFPGKSGVDSPLLHLRCMDVERLDTHSMLARQIARIGTVWLLVWRCIYAIREWSRHLSKAILFLMKSRAGRRLHTFLLDLGSVLSLTLRGWNKSIRFVQKRYEKSVRVIGKSILMYYRRSSKSTKERIKLRNSWWVRRFNYLDIFLIQKAKQNETFRDRAHASWRRFEVWLGEKKKKRMILGKAIHHGYDIRQLSTQSPLIVHLSEKDERAACQMLKTMALSPGDPFVVLHVRGAGSQSALQENDRSRDLSRNALLESFMPAIDEVVARGYRVVRIGDPSMAPLDRPGVIDLATGKVHDVLAQLWAVKNCRFFIAADAGPYLLSWLFNVPCLCVNTTNLLGVYPLRRTDRYLVKRVVNRSSGQPVSLSEMLTETFIYGIKRQLYKEHTLAYLDNTPDEIVSGVREMFAVLDNPDVPATPAQNEVRQLVKQARSGALSRDKMYVKTTSQEIFLGAGQIVDAFAQQHLSAPAETHSA
jgi:putative glycosyltransferase (TIGR04372 family)